MVELLVVWAGVKNDQKQRQLSTGTINRFAEMAGKNPKQNTR